MTAAANDPAPIPDEQLTRSLCLTVACADCGLDWCKDFDSGDGTIAHLPYQSPTDLATYLTTEEGWEFLDGVYVCRPCAARRRISGSPMEERRTHLNVLNAVELAELKMRLPAQTTNAYQALRCMYEAGERGLTDAQLAEVMEVDYPTAAIARRDLSAAGWLEWTGQIRGRGQVRRIRTVGVRAWETKPESAP